MALLCYCYYQWRVDSSMFHVFKICSLLTVDCLAGVNKAGVEAESKECATIGFSLKVGHVSHHNYNCICRIFVNAYSAKQNSHL